MSAALRQQRLLPAVLAALFLAGCAASPFEVPRTPPTLAEAVEWAVDTPPMDQVTWGILAVDLSTGETLYARNESRKFIPASNAKVLVTAAALLEMGPDYRFETAAWPAGELDPDGTLQGDLVIPGDGDPTLSERYWADDEAPLRALVDSLRMLGESARIDAVLDEIRAVPVEKLGERTLYRDAAIAA